MYTVSKTLLNVLISVEKIQLYAFMKLGFLTILLTLIFSTITLKIFLSFNLMELK